MSEGEIVLTPLEQREQEYRRRLEEKLAPLVTAINAALSPCDCNEHGVEIELRWNEGEGALFGHKLAVYDIGAGRFVT